MKTQIQDAMKVAMREKDKARLSTIRLIQAAIKQFEVDNRVEADDTQVLNILDKLVKQRQDSIKQFETANRQDLVDKEQSELEVIRTFMPEPLSDEAIQQHIEQALQQVNATSIKDMGKVMGILKPLLQGRADLGQVGQMIKDKLSS